jgi:hypothetical protein
VEASRDLQDRTGSKLPERVDHRVDEHLTVHIDPPDEGVQTGDEAWGTMTNPFRDNEILDRADFHGATPTKPTKRSSDRVASRHRAAKK